MNGFLRDTFNACCLRFKPLEQYSYSPWIPCFWLTLIALTDSMANADAIAPSPAWGVVFFVLLNWLLTILEALWFAAWFKYIERKPLEVSVFPLVVIASTPQMLAPVLLLVDQSTANLLGFVLMIYGMLVLIRALAASTGKRIGVAAVSAIAFLPVFFILANSLTAVAEQLGWVTFPPSTAPTDTDTESTQ